MIHTLRWDVYTKDNEDLIKRELLVSVTHPKVGENIWTCVKYNIMDKKEDKEDIGLREFDYKLFEEYKDGGVRGRLDRYPYLNHLFQLWPGDLSKNMAKMNEAVGDKNCLDKSGRKKWIVYHFTRNKFWKCIK